MDGTRNQSVKMSKILSIEKFEPTSKNERIFIVATLATEQSHPHTAQLKVKEEVENKEGASVKQNNSYQARKVNAACIAVQHVNRPESVRLSVFRFQREVCSSDQLRRPFQEVKEGREGPRSSTAVRSFLRFFNYLLHK